MSFYNSDDPHPPAPHQNDDQDGGVTLGMFLGCNFEDPVARRWPGGPTVVEHLLPLDHADHDDADDDADHADHDDYADHDDHDFDDDD